MFVYISMYVCIYVIDTYCAFIYVYTSILYLAYALEVKRILQISYSGTWTFPVPVEFDARKRGRTSTCPTTLFVLNGHCP